MNDEKKETVMNEIQYKKFYIIDKINSKFIGNIKKIPIKIHLEIVDSEKFLNYMCNIMHFKLLNSKQIIDDFINMDEYNVEHNFIGIRIIDIHLI